ncbi:two-component system regulatory protein YycI [Natribacillus halophilus]|uniref:Two-component signal transduction system YycFG, regulatory protein YycI n=1 Tax=Natribacillus halophilus TaxID=549003 RepID=A0A1G8L268_9BACI|nr:two-component system regulatory protein YycI [Natribacillus halophilus]SDI49250.1 Two-component signal transduction system YycFG, regulatory protein YycI [Natribacillus halophilus]
MDWNRTKTIFIFTFLLLNTFLIFQLMDNMENHAMNEETGESLQEHIDRQNIEIDTDLPDDDESLSVVRSSILDDLPAEFDIYEEQDVFSDAEFEEGEITVWLEEPYDIEEDNAWAERRDFIDNYVYEGEEYRFANRDESQVNYYYHHEGRTLIAPGNTHLSLYENENGEIESFSQQLIYTENMAEQPTDSAMEAIDILIEENEMTNNSTVVNVDHVYYSALSEEFASDEVMFSPYYRIVVREQYENEEQLPDVYLVSAVEGEVRIQEP